MLTQTVWNPMFLKGEARQEIKGRTVWPAETSSATTSLRRMLVRLVATGQSTIVHHRCRRTGRRGNRYPERVYTETRIEDEGYDFHQSDS
jgi:hypothetical protein